MASGQNIVGTPWDDALWGTDGNDTISGHAGRDQIYAGSGNDHVDGGADDDFVDAGDGNDEVIGGDGKDSLHGGNGNDYVDGGNGNDTIDGGTGNDLMVGGAGNDWLKDVEGNDVLIGGDGNDFIENLAGNDYLEGGDGDDWMNTVGESAGDDTLVGGAGNDELGENAGNNLMLGGAGNDLVLSASAGSDTMDGGDGDDFLSVEGWFGSAHDVVRGGAGRDTLHVVGSNIVANLEEGTLTYNGRFAPEQTGSASLEGIEAFWTSGSGPAHITGSSGDDELFIFSDGATIIGGLGRDTVIGVIGNDRHVLNVAPGEANADFIRMSRHEWEGIDKVVIDSAVMPELGEAGELAFDDERWYAAAGAAGGAEEDDRLVYDTATSNLYYDADGSGDGAAELIANVVVYFNENFEQGPMYASDVIII
jgi:Ca2+-binding RTX toxin-like protein